MKKLILLTLFIVAIIACKKSSDSLNPTTHTVSTWTQDSRLMGVWALDSFQYDGVTNFTDTAGEFGDSMLFTPIRVLPYDWHGDNANLYGTWRTFNDSLWIYYFNDPFLLPHHYNITGSSLVLIDRLTAFPKTMYFHHK